MAVAAPLPHTLTYAAPEGNAPVLPPGAIVRVPLAGRQVTGYVLGPAQPDPALRVLPIAAILCSEPFFPADLVPFYRWIAQYYHHPIGEVIRTALPLAPGAQSGRRLVWTGRGGADAAAAACPQCPDLANAPWLARLIETGELGAAAVRRLWRDRETQRVIRALEQAGFLEIVPTLLDSGGKPKTETVIIPGERLPAELPEPEALDTLVGADEAPLLPSERKLLSIFRELADGLPNPEIPRAALRDAYPNHAPALKRLVTRNLLALRERPVYRDPFSSMERQRHPPRELTPAQKAVLTPIREAVRAGCFEPFLLHGVTGSGKTEVYLQAVAEALAQGTSALVLVPEIALAAQLEADLRARFGETVALLHSGMSDGERVDQWQRVLRGEARVVLGARSAVFAPLCGLGLIVVDEEHESAYKQEDGLLYHGRDLAVLRARQAGCPVLLGSATPALTSYHHAATGKYRLLQLPERVNPQPLPRVELVDMKTEDFAHRLFSARLLDALDDTLARGRQAMLFLNRRGFAAFMQCRGCGHVLECPHCRVSLTLHRARNRLLCHYCGFETRPNQLCPVCGSPDLAGRGSGTERVEEEIAALFPSARVARVDSDSGRSRRDLLKLFAAVRRGEINILVGTQMIAKGLHFPGVTLVGALWADAGLSLPDFRAAERGFARLEQVTGRAGRGGDPGLVIVQTNRPEHYALQLAQGHDYAGLYEREIAQRRPLGYPPFSRLVNLRISGGDYQEVEQTARAAAALLRQRAQGVSVLGPAPAPLEKLRDKFRWQILLKSPDTRALHILCEVLLEQRGKLCPTAVALQVDVDPENML